jgi:hypothetical protein
VARAAPQVSRPLGSAAFSHRRAIRWRMSSFEIRSSARPSKVTASEREQRLEQQQNKTHKTRVYLVAEYAEV